MPADQVIILGSRHLELLVGLMRRGFRQIACLKSGTPTGGAEADLLWVPCADAETDLVGTVSRLRRHLHDGGKLVIQGSTPRARPMLALRRWLIEQGYLVLGQSGKHGFALCARKPAMAALARAA